MNLYYYLFYLLHELFKAARRNNPHWYANLFLTFFMSSNIIELYYIFSKMKNGSYVVLENEIMLAIFLLVYVFNCIMIFNNEKYLTFQQIFDNNNKGRKLILRITASCYIVATILFLFFMKP